MVQSLSKVCPKLVRSWFEVGTKLVRSWSEVGPKLAGLEAPGLAWEPLVQIGPAEEAAEKEEAEAAVGTDNKATQASALSFELGLGVAINMI